MEEELSENELEERMYAMLHYVDETQTNVGTNPKEVQTFDNAPRSTIRRYWRTSDDHNTTYRKVNTPKDPGTHKNDDISQNLSKNEANNRDSSSPDLSIFQQPVSQNLKKTIEIIEHEIENRVVELESSDEDEVIEVALPPKPTITIESSDEDDIHNVTTESTENKSLTQPPQDKTSEREVTSPVPSVVSSVSDEFIRSDCIALNISSKHPNNQSFDFSLHGSDLLDQTPSKKKKKKKNKETTSTPISTPLLNTSTVSLETCFATPKSKAKNKRQRTKSYQVSEKSIPNPDVYDSDSNQSTTDTNKHPNPYSTVDKTLPTADLYESDSNHSKVANNTQDNLPKNDENTDCSIITSQAETPKTLKKNELRKSVFVDLTEPDVSDSINESIVMGNVTGFTEIDDYSDENIIPQGDVSKCGSTRIPAILNADLDFDNLKGNEKVCKRRRYSLTTLRAEMEKFYNESWGGENFNHREIQKNMSRDKSLWVIDPKDRMTPMPKRKASCNYCNRVGHRDDMCRMKPPICFMCGSSGHFEPRCPRKICVNCGSPNHMYSTMCRNCSNWNCIKCSECGQNGHPASHCPDVWRRYHNTINQDSPLEENRQLKKHFQMFCSGCTRRGHLVHTCRITLPFSGLPINSPYVAVYRPVYAPMPNDSTQNPNNQRNKKNRNVSEDSNASPGVQRNEQLKRQSKSPVIHESHQNKKRNVVTDTPETQKVNSPIINNMQRKSSQSKDQADPTKDVSEEVKNTKKVSESQDSDKAPDFIPISSENHDKKGHMIQDNEVSDTSEVITSARVYITKAINGKLQSEEGKTWLTDTLNKNSVTLENEDTTLYLSIKGTIGNQEAFQGELRDWIGNNLRDWIRSKENTVSENEADAVKESTDSENALSNNIPKNKNNALRKLNRAFASLKRNLGNPKDLYKQLLYLQKQHQQITKQKVVSPKQLSNNRENMKSNLKRLNMILLGQAGLADGPQHLSELHGLQEKLTNFRQKNIPVSLREEIGEHYRSIFTAIPRQDYEDLLSKYYNIKQISPFKHQKYNKIVTVPMLNPKKTTNNMQNVEKNTSDGDKKMKPRQADLPIVEATKNKLVFYQRRLLCLKPNNSVLKKKIEILVRKLFFNICLINNRPEVSSKALKKMKKVQEQAQEFLINV